MHYKGYELICTKVARERKTAWMVVDKKTASTKNQVKNRRYEEKWKSKEEGACFFCCWIVVNRLIHVAIAN